MIAVPRPAEPEGFDRDCRQPGKQWLAANPDADPHKHSLWSEYRLVLREAFRGRCGFLALYTPKGTVDHWVSLKADRDKAYDWDNYRFVDGAVNSAKKPGWDGKLLDPYEVQDDWFEVKLPSLQLVIANIPDAPTREKADFTLTKLGLRDGEDVIRLRREWLYMYEAGKLKLDGLRDVAPLIARAVEKRDQQAHAETAGQP